MGMYTDFYLTVELAKDTPSEVTDTLKVMTTVGGPVPLDSALPRHALFQTRRWEYMLTSANCEPCWSSFGLDWFTKRWCLSVRSSFKNYDGEINLFLDWLNPYIINDGFIGFHLYEQYESPTLIYRLGNRIVEMCVPEIEDEDEFARSRLRLELAPHGGDTIDGEVLDTPRSITSGRGRP